MTFGGHPPGSDEFELTLFGPGYGESLVLHVGDGVWVLIDSCGRADAPAALDYLRMIDVDPSEAVRMIVATHWHDDHIRGLAEMVRVCAKASFCCANVLCTEEFLAMVGALEGRHYASFSSGTKELYRVFSILRSNSSTPTMAIANRRIFTKGACYISALSPADDAYLHFLKTIDRLIPAEGRTETRIRSLSPNEVSVVLRVEVNDIAVLLGSDLDQRGWLKILHDRTRPQGTASVFKVPHHGSAGADEPRVWRELLTPDPVTLLTPWQRAGRTLPNSQDVRRILARTSRAYAAARIGTTGRSRRRGAVERTIRQSGIKLRRTPKMGAVRLRRRLHPGEQWQFEMFGTACSLNRIRA